MTFPMSLTHLGMLDSVNASAVKSYIDRQGLGITGKVYYCDPVNGTDGDGLSPATAMKKLSDAYNLMTSGNNDVLVLIGNGALSGSVTLSSAFTWSKNACHLVGVCSPSMLSQRARIGTLTSATAFANFFTVSGNGCLFYNLELIQDFATGVASEITLSVSGSRNAFVNCHIAGMVDTTGATSAGSRVILITADENYFAHCVIGADTVTKTNANAVVEIQGGAARTIFEDCVFPILSSDGLQYFFLSAAAAAFDRFVMFKGCNFISAVGSTGTAIATAFKLAASSGGIVVFDSTSGLFGVTAIGDATSKAQTYVSGGTATNGVKGVVAT